MSWLLLGVCCVLFVELFGRVGVMRRAREADRLLRRALRVIRSARISDHWKERAVPRYAGSLFASSLLMFGALLVALSPFAVAGVIADFLGVPFLQLLSSLGGIVAACVFAVAWARFRPRPR